MTVNSVTQKAGKNDSGAPKPTRRQPAKKKIDPIDQIAQEAITQAKMWMRRDEILKAVTILESADERVKELAADEAEDYGQAILALIAGGGS